MLPENLQRLLDTCDLKKLLTELKSFRDIHPQKVLEAILEKYNVILYINEECREWFDNHDREDLFQLIKFAIENGANPAEIKVIYGNIFHFAANSNNQQLVDYLIQYNKDHSNDQVDINDVSLQSFTPLCYAITTQNLGVIKSLMEAGAKIFDSTTTHLRSNPIMIALQTENFDIVKYVMQNKELKGKEITPYLYYFLSLAVRSGDLENVRYVCETFNPDFSKYSDQISYYGNNQKISLVNLALESPSLEVLIYLFSEIAKSGSMTQEFLSNLKQNKSSIKFVERDNKDVILDKDILQLCFSRIDDDGNFIINYDAITDQNREEIAEKINMLLESRKLSDLVPKLIDNSSDNLANTESLQIKYFDPENLLSGLVLAPLEEGFVTVAVTVAGQTGTDTDSEVE